MSWKFEDFAGIGGGKDLEFRKILHLPSLTDAPVELAVNGPKELLREHGWRCRDAFSVSHNLDAYRDYLRSSLGEFGVAKGKRNVQDNDQTRSQGKAQRAALLQPQVPAKVHARYHIADTKAPKHQRAKHAVQLFFSRSRNFVGHGSR